MYMVHVNQEFFLLIIGVTNSSNLTQNNYRVARKWDGELVGLVVGVELPN